MGNLSKRCDKESRCCTSLLPKINETWHQFYAVLDCEKLTLYQSKDDVKQYLAAAIVLLSEIHSIVKYASKDIEHGIQLTASGRIFHFSCSSETDQEEWISTIKKSIAYKHDAAINDGLMVGFPLKDAIELRPAANRQYGLTIFIKLQNENEVLS